MLYILAKSLNTKNARHAFFVNHQQDHMSSIQFNCKLWINHISFQWGNCLQKSKKITLAGINHYLYLIKVCVPPKSQNIPLFWPLFSHKFSLEALLGSKYSFSDTLDLTLPIKSLKRALVNFCGPEDRKTPF